MTDYSKCKIYKIESLLGDKIYIGSTCKEYLSQRFAKHKNDYKRWKDEKYNKITSFDLFDLYGSENCNIILIEEYPCTSKDAKNAREAHYIRELNCVNKIIPGRTRIEYRNDNKEKLQNLKKDYDLINVEKNKKYQKEYRDKKKKLKKQQQEEQLKELIV